MGGHNNNPKPKSRSQAKRLKIQLGAVRNIKDTGQLKRKERLVSKLVPVKGKRRVKSKGRKK